MYTYFKKIPVFFSKIIYNFSFKINSITLDPDLNWAKILDPDQNSMYLAKN